ncbi:MAG: tetratricopeptide repeat protein [Chloroflexi bacterium]|nr:tetratricopeptide repeat protein [Chloroflexota bacterium]MCI0576797.1 tetratricopeptide repeat protein [Chloroflexota bacterium]MCI0643304.1 tetratricopeptide repeat protein [Chloroflexota bacterium]MCI0725169.1 tetratricopeptide repeat protein [Chloroflexota bacterium]
MGQLQLFLLGPPEVRLDGAPLVLPSAKVRALLFYLAVTGRPHDRGHLAGLLWGDLPEESARRNLRVALNKLRQRLNEHLLADYQTLAFNPEAPHWLDVAVLEETRQAEREAGRGLRAAVALYRGEFLHGFQVRDAPEFEAWMTLERERLRQKVLAARQALAEAAEAQGDVAAAIEDVRAILAIDSWREEAHQQLMRLLAQSGRRSQALAQYEICRRILAEELAVEPAPATVALYEQIRAGGLGVQTESFSLSPPPPLSPSHNLPAETTPFVGRQEELAQIAGLLADPGCRLLTLFGPGGIGKTRLALQAARQAVDAFPDGVYLVALEAIGSTGLLVTAIAAALNVPLTGRPEPKTQLLAALRERQMLLALDNFEHLLAGSELLVELLEEAPGVKLLVTSREALNLYEEWLLAVAGLSYPPAGSLADPARFEAVDLFWQRARRVQLSFSLAGNEAAVAEICRLLLGMPLGIELAAAWVRTIPCAEIARHIAANLDLLTTSLRNVPARHRSMVAVFDHSWELLRPAERQLLRRLSVFRGGFIFAAACEVAGAGRRDLSVLVDKALLHVAAAGRYDIHPLIRHYAAGKLAGHLSEEAESRTRHVAFYAALLAGQETAVKSRDQQQAFQLIAGELDNVRAAWDTAIAQGQAGHLDQMVEPLFHFYGKRGLHQEGFQRFDQAVAAIRPQGSPPLLARLLVRQGRLGEHISRDYAIPQRLLAEGLALARQERLPVESAQALLGLGVLALIRGDPEQAGNHLSEGLAICRQANIPWTMASILSLLAWLRSDEGQVEQAKAMCREAIAIHRKAGDTNGVAATLTTLGKIYSDLGEWKQAAAAYGEALAICRRNGHQVGLAQALTGLFNTCYRRGDLAGAAAYAQESVAVNREVGDRLGTAIAYHNLGFLAADAGQYREAVDHYRQALAIYQAISADGARRSNTHRHLAESLLALGETAAAGEHVYEALRALPEGIYPQRALELLLTCARLLVRLGEAAPAAGIVAWLQDDGRLPTAVEPQLLALVKGVPAAATIHSPAEGLAAVRSYLEQFLSRR